jgi:dolichol-phosphate mannosyltransferase
MITIVIPIYNEEEGVRETYNQIAEVLKKTKQEWELIFVDDGSKDNSFSIIKEIGRKDTKVRGLKFSRNFGQYAAVSAGIHHAKGDAIIIMDADLQEPPSLIPELLRQRELGYKAVYTSALTRKDSFLRKLFGWIFYTIFGKASLWGNVQNISEMRLIDRDIANAFVQLKEKPRFLKGMFFWLGYPHTIVKYEKQKREFGVSKYSFSKLAKLALDGIFSFSSIPLQFILFLGVIFLIISVVYLIFPLVLFLLGNPSVSFSITLFAILFLGSIQLLSVGIIGEYISRIHDEVRQRPNFIIEDRINF